MKPTHPTSDEELDSEEWDRVLSGRLSDMNVLSLEARAGLFDGVPDL